MELRCVRLFVAVLCFVPASRLAYAQAAADYSKEAFVIEQSKTTIRYENDGTGRRELYMRVKPLTDAGVQGWGQLEFGYNSANERPVIDFVRVHQLDGTVVTAPDSAVQDLTSPIERAAPVYTDFRQKHVTVPSLRPGEVLEFQVVTTVFAPVAPGQFWGEYEFNHEAIILDEQLLFDLPKDRTVMLKTLPGFDAVVADANGRRQYTWHSAHLKREEEDTKANAKAKEQTSEPQRPDVRMTTFHNWEEVGAWFDGLMAPQVAPSAEVRAKAVELTRNRSTPAEKAQALYDYVALDFRYVSLSLGVGRYRPRAAAEVLRDQYGDCKDKHTLLASLLESIGVHSSPALINSRVKIDPAFPAPSQFDHVITKASIAGADVWLDSTTEVAPFGLLSANLRKRQALVVPSGGHAVLAETPADPPMLDEMHADVTGQLSDLGRLSAHVKVTVRGDLELPLRYVFRQTPEANWKELIARLSSSAGLAGEVSKWMVGDPAATHQPFTFEYDVVSPNFADWMTKRAEIALPLVSNTLEPPASDTTAVTEPINLGAPQAVTYTLHLDLPAGSTPHVPVPLTVDRDYGSYRTVYTVTGTSVTADRRLAFTVGELPAGRRRDFDAFRHVILEDAKQRLSVDHVPASTSGAAPGTDAAELNRAGYDALTNGHYAQAVALLTRVTELDPKDHTVWNNLGDAYLNLRQYDAARGAYQHQIDLDPYDASVYNNLGSLAERQANYTDAEKFYRKQLEVNPLDKWTHSALGELFLNRRRYKEAVPELEQAVSLAPDDAWLRVQLGKAYFKNERRDDALKAFDRAIEIAPTPLTWNDVAYELAVAGVDLDRAQRYAESAVTATAAASRNLDLTHVGSRELSVVGSLASYWDTLGWVQFARGDVDHADHYVRASWLLSQDAEVGDHVGLILEKRGHTDDAIRAYAVALSSVRPSDDLRDHLAHLAGAGRVDGLMASNKAVGLADRTHTIAVHGAAGAKADFFLLVSNSGVEAVKFAGGDERLRGAADALKRLDVKGMFPDATPARLIRRGTLACVTETSCAVTLQPTGDVDPER